MTSYKYASVVRLVDDDPCNDLDEGQIFIEPGKHDEYSYDVLDESVGGFATVECEVLGDVEADYWMSKDEIKDWAADQDEALEIAQEAEV